MEVSYISLLKFLKNPSAYCTPLCGFTISVLGTQTSAGKVLEELLTRCKYCVVTATPVFMLKFLDAL